MAHLPPAGWGEVATKRDLDALRGDLDALETRFEARLDATKYELLATFRAELNAQTRTMMLTMSGLMVTLAGLAFTAARII